MTRGASRDTQPTGFIHANYSEGMGGTTNALFAGGAGILRTALDGSPPMASNPEERPTRSGPSRWRIVWYENGRKEQATFYTHDDAVKFKHLVEFYGNQWPPPTVWDRQHACLAEQAPSDKPTFKAYADQTLKNRHTANPGTKRGYDAMLERHVYPLLGDTPIDRIDRNDIAALIAALKTKNLSPKTITNIHGTVSSILKDAVTDRHIDRNPAVGTLGMKGRRRKPRTFLTPAEFALLLKHIAEHYKPLVELAAGTGLRWGEITALQVRDVEVFDRPVIHIRQAWKRGTTYHELGSPKTDDSDRTISLSAQLRDLLIGTGIAHKQPGEFVFTNEYGRPVIHSHFRRRIWLPALEAAAADGLTKRPTFHTLRHTHASWLIADGIEPLTISRRLGHGDIQVTFNTYGHLMPDSDEKINAAVDRALARQP